MLKELEKCRICPRECNVNRMQGKVGNCKASNKIEIALVSLHKFEEPCISGSNKIEIALVSLHKFEEPCISGENGSGTIFFAHCNMHCVFCQNYEISQELGNYKETSIEELADIMVHQQEMKAENINLVTPTMYAYQIREAIKIAKGKGLNIPIIYNSNGYENEKTIKALEGYIDIYLPDLKYYSNELAEKYSKAPNYFEVATEAIKKMIEQVGVPKFDERGMIKKGVMIRHLVLPNHIQNTKNILKWVKENLPEEIYINVMAQYFPTYKAKEDELLNRKLTRKEYKQVEQYFYLLDFKNGYMQELGEHEEEYVPKWAANVESSD